MAGQLVVIKGDATSPVMASEDERVIVPHVTNDEGGWGAGFVVALSRKWSEPEAAYRSDFQIGRARGGEMTLVKVPVKGLMIANMTAQHSYKSDKNPRPLNYLWLAKCMDKVATEAVNLGASIHCPKFGSDLAGGDWDFIMLMIQDIWLARGINVTVYEYDG